MIFLKIKKLFIFGPWSIHPKSTNVQIPGYLNLAEKIFEQGIDEIICVSVNDAFVMDAWAQHCKAREELQCSLMLIVIF